MSKSKSMHENVPTWCDTCCCEPEPRWQALAEEEADRRDERPRRRDSDEGRASPPAD